MRLPSPSWRIRLAGMTALLPLILTVYDPPWLRRALETEGLVEALTELLLVGLAFAGIRRRSWWIVLGALVLVAEEVDYGQRLFGFETPTLVDQLSPRNDRMNLHNIPYLEWFWRPLPPILVALLGRRPWPRGEPLLVRWGAPAFHVDAWQGLLLAVIGTALCARLEHRASNEALELAMVLVVACAWRPPARARNALRAPGGS